MAIPRQFMNYPGLRGSRRANPLLRDVLASYRYYWATNQAEYVTEVVLRSPFALRALYGRLLRHATLCLRPEDVITFLGRKLHGDSPATSSTTTSAAGPGRASNAG